MYLFEGKPRTPQALLAFPSQNSDRLNLKTHHYKIMSHPSIHFMHFVPVLHPLPSMKLQPQQSEIQANIRRHHHYRTSTYHPTLSNGIKTSHPITTSPSIPILKTPYHAQCYTTILRQNIPCNTHTASAHAPTSHPQRPNQRPQTPP